jgi:hypothetical protein
MWLTAAFILVMSNLVVDARSAGNVHIHQRHAAHAAYLTRPAHHLL